MKCERALLKLNKSLIQRCCCSLTKTHTAVTSNCSSVPTETLFLNNWFIFHWYFLRHFVFLSSVVVSSSIFWCLRIRDRLVILPFIFKEMFWLCLKRDSLELVAGTLELCFQSPKLTTWKKAFLNFKSWKYVYWSLLYVRIKLPEWMIALWKVLFPGNKITSG